MRSPISVPHFLAISKWLCMDGEYGACPGPTPRSPGCTGGPRRGEISSRSGRLRPYRSGTESADCTSASPCCSGAAIVSGTP